MSHYDNRINGWETVDSNLGVIDELANSQAAQLASRLHSAHMLLSARSRDLKSLVRLRGRMLDREGDIGKACDTLGDAINVDVMECMRDLFGVHHYTHNAS